MAEISNVKYLSINQNFFNPNFIYYDIHGPRSNKFIGMTYKTPTIFLDGLMFETPWMKVANPIEISGKNSIDVLKKGTSLNLNPTEFMKNNSANSSYSGISFIVDFISDSPLTFRLFCLRSFGGSFYHSITDAALEYGYSGE